MVRGIGDRIEPLSGAPALALLLANPGIPLATAEVYRLHDELGSALTPWEPGSTMRRFAELRERGLGIGAEALSALLVNDLERAAQSLCPSIAVLRERLLDAGALAVGLSGSGPTLFGVFEEREAADAARRREAFRPPTWTRVAATLPSP